MHEVMALILGGGRGERLYPLTKMRAKPALPLAGKYRLIDIPVSNCINSQIMRIYVLTQFNSASLNQHITNTYRFYPFMKGFVEVLAAQQTPVSPDWFQGTADAVRKTLWLMESMKFTHYLILSGDHLYRMDYRLFIQEHRESGADLTIGVTPVEESRASGFGLMKIDSRGRVVDFREKPMGDTLVNMRVDTRAFTGDEGETKPYLASMGIYVFNRDALVELLKKYPEYNDFGKHLIPAAITDYNVHSYVFRGYWEDIGTIETFYQANLGLTRQPNPAFSFYDAEFPIFTRPRSLPPSKILDSCITDSMICDGCIVRSSKLEHSIVGVRSRLEEHTQLENVLLMGADEVESDAERATDLASGLPPVGIGDHSVIRNAIIDKNVRIGRNVQIINKDNVENVERESEGYWIRSGIVVIIKGAVIPDHTII
jgi:glucose-1-phosphate adenylyltransferase